MPTPSSRREFLVRCGLLSLGAAAAWPPTGRRLAAALPAGAGPVPALTPTDRRVLALTAGYGAAVCLAGGGLLDRLPGAAGRTTLLRVLVLVPNPGALTGLWARTAAAGLGPVRAAQNGLRIDHDATTYVVRHLGPAAYARALRVDPGADAGWFAHDALLFSAAEGAFTDPYGVGSTRRLQLRDRPGPPGERFAAVLDGLVAVARHRLRPDRAFRAFRDDVLGRHRTTEEEARAVTGALLTQSPEIARALGPGILAGLVGSPLVTASLRRTLGERGGPAVAALVGGYGSRGGPRTGLTAGGRTVPSPVA